MDCGIHSVGARVDPSGFGFHHSFDLQSMALRRCQYIREHSRLIFQQSQHRIDTAQLKLRQVTIGSTHPHNLTQLMIHIYREIISRTHRLALISNLLIRSIANVTASREIMNEGGV